MISLADAVRPYWAYGLNDINYKKGVNFSSWMENAKDYQVLTQVLNRQFEINTTERKTFLIPISQDCNRFSSSCLESAIIQNDPSLLPKSLSWIMIRTYYSAFYSGHYLLRLLGFSLSQLDRNVINSVEKIADLYGYRNGINIEKGFYLCDYSSRDPRILFSKIDISTDEGSHGAMWKILCNKLSFISNDILIRNVSVDYQPISIKIAQLVDNLKSFGATNGTWLSKIRNDINYKHLYGTWYPYADSKSYYKRINGLINLWQTNPLEIELKNLVGQELVRFFSSCQFLIGFAREISIDMNKRCSVGMSFHHYGCISLLNHLKFKLS